MFASGIVASGLALIATAAERLRPAGRARGRAVRATRRVRRELARTERVETDRERSLGRAAKSWESVAARKRLERVPVTELRNFGAENVRWSVVEESGYGTVADLVHVTRAQLEALDGVGPKSAARLVEARDRIVAANAEEPASPPALDAREPEATRVVRAAGELLAVRDAVRPTLPALRALRDETGADLREVRKKASIFRGWLGGKREQLREEAIRDAARLTGRVAAAEDEGGALANARAARAAAGQAVALAQSDDELHRLHATRVTDFIVVIERALAGGKDRGRDALRGGLPLEVARRVEAFELNTDGLAVTLRGYQEFGAKYLLVQRRTLLGDEMGLGKTVEALAVLSHVAHEEGGKHYVVVAPASVLSNWARETTRHTRLPVVVLHGAERDARLAAWAADGGVAVTSFGTLRRLALIDGALSNMRIDVLIVDEAHYAKNPEAARTRSIMEMAARSDRVCYMSGTPLENRIDEFCSLIGQLQPELANKLASDVPADDGLVVGRRAFLTAVAPVYLRRNQRDVLRELPARIDKEEWIDLAPHELDAYRDAVAERKIMTMRRAATLGVARRGERSSKLARLAELLDEYREDGRKVLVFSFFLDVLGAVEEAFDCVGAITGAVPPADRQALVDAFGAVDGHAILLGQIDAAGTGLNLQAASAVVLLEPQWKPSTEEQAIARAHRMGQTRSVIVHRFFASDTVDERMKEVLGEKQELFDAFARESAVRDASSDATETSLTKRVVDAEVARLGLERSDAPTP